jgi:hypothetical protein
VSSAEWGNRGRWTVDGISGTAAAFREEQELKKADFRTFYRDAHAVECLTEREKMLIGLTVAMMRLCDP